MNNIVDEPELLTEVPYEFKKLARIVVRAFFESEHVAVINVLTKKSCVREDDLMDFLKFDKRQLRTSLVKLKNDKLIKQRTHKEKQSETGNTSFHYFFINYKVFVNVVKYKLNHIRAKIESEEKQARNRSSYVCSSCESRYTDLDIDRLMADIMSGSMTCPQCGSSVDEDLTDIQQTNNSRSLLALFNEQMATIFELLRQCENVRLAPEILEPEPDMTMSSSNRSSAYNGGFKPGWSTDRSGLETNDPGIKINMGDEDDKDSDKLKAKEVPIWMMQSTVDPVKKSEELNIVDGAGTSKDSKSNDSNHDEIHAILMAHESVAKKPRLDVKAALGDDADGDSDSSEDFVAADTKKTEAAAVAMETIEGNIESDDDDDDDNDDVVKIKIGDKMVSLFEVTNEMTEKMTPEEHDAYDKACQLAYGNYY